MQHPTHVDEGTVRTHEGVYCRLVDYQVESLVRVRHLPHVHHIVLHFTIPLFMLTLLHLLDNHSRDVIAHDVMVAVLVKVLLNTAVATSYVEDPAFLTPRKTLLQVGLGIYPYTLSLS